MTAVELNLWLLVIACLVFALAQMLFGWKPKNHAVLYVAVAVLCLIELGVYR